MDEISACSTSSPKAQPRFGKVRRISGEKLPTPPPDPASPSSSQDSDDVFISSNALEYIKSLQKTMFTSVIATEDAFDHLDKLHKVMEQMLDLRQQNARLLNRIRNLEHLKTLGVMHRQLSNSGLTQNFDDDDDTVCAQSVQADTRKDFKNKPWARSRLTQSIAKRQASPGGYQIHEKDAVLPSRKLSSSSGREKSSKVSKWTKVKAAFRWEKASPSVTGAKSQDSGIGGMTPINFEIARYLRVPSSDEAGNSPADSGAADGSTPGSLSSASSNDEIHRQEIRRDSQFSDEDRKCTSRKDMHTRSKESIKRAQHYQDKSITANRSEDEKFDASDKECSASSQRSSTKLSKYRQRRNTKVQIPDDVVKRYQKALADDECASKNTNRKRISKWVRVKKAFLNPAMDEHRNKHPPLIDEGAALYKTTDERNKIQEETQDNYKQLQNKLSLEFKGKLLEWDKIRATSSGTSSSVSEEPRDPAFAKKMEEWEKIKTQPLKQSQCTQIVREADLPPEFKKKLEEWQKIKKHPAKDDLLPKSKKKIGEWPRWKSISGHREEHAYSDYQPISEDFRKKLEEWKKIKETNKQIDVGEKTPSPSTARRHSQTIATPILKPKEAQNLQWFESELNKIEMERKRLEAERQKFLQREERLGKLRRTVLGNEDKKDVLIHTPSGFHRFEGISKKFTQKLCEWETSQGIGPEASTFALLTSSFTPHITVNLCDKEIEDLQPRLHRSKSAESLAVSHLDEVFQAISHHPSSLSLNDIDELERQCLALSTDSSCQNISQSLENLDNDEPEAVIVEVEDVVEETAAPLEEYLEEKHFPIYQRESVLNTCEQQPLVVPHVEEASSFTNPQYCFYLLEEMLQLAATLSDSEAKILLNSQNDVWVKNGSGAVFKVTDEDKEKMHLKDENSKQNHFDVLMTKLIRLHEIHSKNVANIFKYKEQKPTTTHFADLLESSQDLFAQLFQMIGILQHNPEYSDTDYSEKTKSIYGKFVELKRIFSYFYATSDMTAPRRKPKDIKRVQYVCEEIQKVDDNVTIDNDTDLNNEVDPSLVQKFVISTNTNYLTQNETSCTHEPSNIFVNTTRRLFTTIEETRSCISKEPREKYPLMPESPTMQRKLPKEISPGIRVMLAKYNQMITGQDLPKTSNGGSSSPIAWRSPVSERRVKARRERYIEELAKIKTGGHDVIKSASSAVLNINLNRTDESHAEPNKGILRSTSASVIQNKFPPLSVEIFKDAVKPAVEERYNKLQKAKEEFLRTTEVVDLPLEPSSAPPTCSKELVFSTRNRYSQVSMGSESSYDSNACALVKSASVGMIDAEVLGYEQADSSVHQYGYLSLPRAATKQKGGILEGLSSIAAKFRKVKMKRHRKMNTVSALCRQSLVVDLNPGSQESISVKENLRRESLTVPTPSSSEDTSPSSSRSGSWIRRSKIFKAL